MGRDYCISSNAEGVSRYNGESLRQKDLYWTHLWRESLRESDLSKGSPKGKL